ncbi:MAG: metalloregulator ArsR/SmtB family transcription factor [Gemmatimonadales bacterium]|jgi:DNA-binding transcriptional ArsR family regulator
MTYVSPLNALADSTRRAIVERIRERPRAVGELAALLPVSQPAVSQHLRVLREAGLVERRKQGARRIYSLRAQGVAELRAYVESLWDDVLAAFQAGVAGEGDGSDSDGDVSEASTRRGDSR